ARRRLDDVASFCALRERTGIDDRDPAAVELDRSAPRLGAEDAVDRGPRRSGQSGQLRLGERDDRRRAARAEERRELWEAAEHAGLGRDEEGLRQQIAGTPQTPAEQPGEDGVHLRVALP